MKYTGCDDDHGHQRYGTQSPWIERLSWVTSAENTPQHKTPAGSTQSSGGKQTRRRVTTRDITRRSVPLMAELLLRYCSII